MFRRNGIKRQPLNFNQIKQLPYFKNLISLYQNAVLHQLLKISIQHETLIPHKYFVMNFDYVYVVTQDSIVKYKSNQHKTIVKKGSRVQQFQDQILTYEPYIICKLEKRIQSIYKIIKNFKTQILKQIKHRQDLYFLINCHIYHVSFGSYLFHKNQNVQGFFLIVEGQVKLIYEKNQRKIQFATLENGKIFGYKQQNQNYKKRQLSARVSQNNTSVLFVPKKIFNNLSLQKQQLVILLLGDHQTQQQSINRIPKTIQNILKPIIATKKHVDQSLQKRFKKYEIQNRVKNKVMQQIVFSKGLYLKIKSNNSNSDRILSQNKTVQTAQDIKKYNQKWKKKKTFNSTIIISKSNHNSKSVQRSLLGLTKYPSVQRFRMNQTLRTKQDDYLY